MTSIGTKGNDMMDIHNSADDVNLHSRLEKIIKDNINWNKQK